MYLLSIPMCTQCFLTTYNYYTIAEIILYCNDVANVLFLFGNMVCFGI